MTFLIFLDPEDLGGSQSKISENPGTKGLIRFQRELFEVGINRKSKCKTLLEDNQIKLKHEKNHDMIEVNTT